MFQRLARTATTILLAGILALSGGGALAAQGHVVLPEPLSQPDWQLPVIANGQGSLSSSDFSGQVLYVDFWASWCGPCRLSLPAINRLFEEFNETGFQVVAISVDYVEADALDFLKRYPVDYPVLLDSTGDSGRAFAVSGMPSGYLIDRSGAIREVHVGFRKGDEALLRDSIARLLNEATP